MKAQEIMTKNPALCMATTKLDEVARLMVDSDCGEIPVVRSKEKAELLGVITDRDITCRAVALGKNPSTTPASEIMSSPAVTVSPETDLMQCCKLFEEKEIRRLPVVDQKGHCIGILSLTDVAEKAPEQYARELLRYSSKGTVRPGAAAH
jgi:CBS domain-containing protein